LNVQLDTYARSGNLDYYNITRQQLARNQADLDALF
jgi:hypothetical protein